MQIHDLNTKALTDPAYVAFDDGTDTYKTEFNDVVANAAAAAVADADLTDNTVAFTSGDAASPTAWTAVDVLTSGLSLKTLFNRISTMVKNVRYIWDLLGSSSFSNVASTLTGAIGNTALTTTAQTLSGAIAEHESNISTLNSKKIVQSQFALPSSVVIGAGSKATLLSSVNPRDLTKTALDNIPSTGTLKAAVMTWSSGGDCIATDTLVQNGVLSLQARNPTSGALTISAIRLLLLYE